MIQQTGRCTLIKNGDLVVLKRPLKIREVKLGEYVDTVIVRVKFSSSWDDDYEEIELPMKLFKKLERKKVE